MIGILPERLKVFNPLGKFHKELHKLITCIESKKKTDISFLNPSVPRNILNYMSTKYFWGKQAKSNGLVIKDLYRNFSI